MTMTESPHPQQLPQQSKQRSRLLMGGRGAGGATSSSTKSSLSQRICRFGPTCRNWPDCRYAHPERRNAKLTAVNSSSTTSNHHNNTFPPAATTGPIPDVQPPPSHKDGEASAAAHDTTVTTTTAKSTTATTATAVSVPAKTVVTSDNTITLTTTTRSSTASTSRNPPMVIPSSLADLDAAAQRAVVRSRCPASTDSPIMQMTIHRAVLQAATKAAEAEASSTPAKCRYGCKCRNWPRCRFSHPERQTAVAAARDGGANKPVSPNSATTDNSRSGDDYDEKNSQSKERRLNDAVEAATTTSGSPDSITTTGAVAPSPSPPKNQASNPPQNNSSKSNNSKSRRNPLRRALEKNHQASVTVEPKDAVQFMDGITIPSGSPLGPPVPSSSSLQGVAGTGSATITTAVSYSLHTVPEQPLQNECQGVDVDYNNSKLAEALHISKVANDIQASVPLISPAVNREAESLVSSRLSMMTQRSTIPTTEPNIQQGQGRHGSHAHKPVGVKVHASMPLFSQTERTDESLLLRYPMMKQRSTVRKHSRRNKGSDVSNSTHDRPNEVSQSNDVICADRSIPTAVAPIAQSIHQPALNANGLKTAAGINPDDANCSHTNVPREVQSSGLTTKSSCALDHNGGGDDDDDIPPPQLRQQPHAVAKRLIRQDDVGGANNNAFGGHHVEPKGLTKHRSTYSDDVVFDAVTSRQQLDFYDTGFQKQSKLHTKDATAPNATAANNNKNKKQRSKTTTTPCRYGAKCHRRNCVFVHPPPLHDVASIKGGLDDTGTATGQPQMDALTVPVTTGQDWKNSNQHDTSSLSYNDTSPNDAILLQPNDDLPMIGPALMATPDCCGGGSSSSVISPPNLRCPNQKGLSSDGSAARSTTAPISARTITMTEPSGISVPSVTPMWAADVELELENQAHSQRFNPDHCSKLGGGNNLPSSVPILARPAVVPQEGTRIDDAMQRADTPGQGDSVQHGEEVQVAEKTSEDIHDVMASSSILVDEEERERYKLARKAAKKERRRVEQEAKAKANDNNAQQQDHGRASPTASNQENINDINLTPYLEEPFPLEAELKTSPSEEEQRRLQVEEIRRQKVIAAEKKKSQKKARYERFMAEQEEQAKEREALWKERIASEIQAVHKMVHLCAAEFCRNRPITRSLLLLSSGGAVERQLTAECRQAYRHLCGPDMSSAVSRIMVKGHMKQPEWNNRMGTIYYWDEDKGQFCVAMDPKKGKNAPSMMFFGPAHLEPVNDGSKKKCSSKKQSYDPVYMISIGDFYNSKSFTIDLYKSDVDRLLRATDLVKFLHGLMEERNKEELFAKTLFEELLRQEEEARRRRAEQRRREEEEWQQRQQQYAEQKRQYEAYRAEEARKARKHGAHSAYCNCPECQFLRLFMGGRGYFFGGFANPGSRSARSSMGGNPFAFGNDDDSDNDDGDEWDRRWNRQHQRDLVTKKQKAADVLGVPVDATATEIKRVYRKKVLQYHPDKFRPEMHNHDITKEQAEDHFKELASAYDELMSTFD